MAPTRTAATLAITLFLLLVVVGPVVVPAAQPGTATAALLSDERRSSPQGGQLTIIETDDTTEVGTPTATDEALTATPALSTATATTVETVVPTVTVVETTVPTATAVQTTTATVAPIETVTPTVTVIETATPTTTETQLVDDTTSDLTNTTDDTTSDLTNTTDDTTSDLTNTTDDTTADLTNTTENVTSDLANTTDDTTSGLTNTTENITSDLTNTTENITSDLTNTTENVTSDLTNTTENITGGLSDVTETTRRIETDDRPSETAATDGSTATPGSNETATENRTTAVAGPAGEEGAGDGMPTLPSDRETMIVGALAVAGLAAAAASKQAAITAAVTPPADLQLLGQTIRQQVTAVAGDARDRLGQALRVILPFGYSQYDDSDPLEHEVRRSLFEQIEREPGVNLSTLADDSEVSLSTVRHHLRILTNERLVTNEKIRGQRRYFPQNEAEPALIAALDDEATAPILRTLARTGPATVSDLADALGRDPSTISYHLSRLDNDGLIERERDGQAKVNRLAPVARRTLASEADRRRMATD